MFTIIDGKTFIDPKTGLAYPSGAVGVIETVSYLPQGKQAHLVVQTYLNADARDNGMPGIKPYKIKVPSDKYDDYFSDLNLSAESIRQAVLDHIMVKATYDRTDPDNIIELTPDVLASSVLEWTA